MLDRKPVCTHTLKKPVKMGDEEIKTVNVYDVDGYVMEEVPEPSLAKGNLKVGDFYPALERLIAKEKSFIFKLHKDDLSALIMKLGE